MNLEHMEIYAAVHFIFISNDLSNVGHVIGNIVFKYRFD